MNRIRLLTATIALVMVAAPTAQADLASVAAAIGAPINPGLAPTGIFGTVIGGYEGSGYMLTPLGAPAYDYAMPSPMGAAAGDVRDFHWIHESSGAFAAPALGTKWTFGGLSATEFILDPSVDHPPIPEEAFETTLYGSSDGGATWVLGTLVEIYAPGWHPGSIEDEPSSRWVFSTPVSMISATAGFTQGTFYFGSADSEIDTISIIPAPGAIALGAIGLGLVGWFRRRLS